MKQPFKVGRDRLGTENLVGPVAVCALLASLGCQSVAKLEDRVADPPPQDVCTLPTEGDAKIRIANFFPATTNVDFCFKQAGAASYTHPILRNSGKEASCADGLAYKQMTVPFATKSGALDVKVVPAGPGGCGQGALSETLNVPVPSGAVTQILHLGGHADPSSVIALREGLNSSTFKVRFLNAISGLGPMDFGLADGPRVPTTMQVSFVDQHPIAFGTGLPPGTKVVTGGTTDELAYMAIQGTTLNFGGSKAGDPNAVFAINIKQATSKYTMYAVGDPTDIRFPPRALLCDENAVIGSTGGALLGCVESELPSLAFEVYGAALYGKYAKYSDERLVALPGEIAKNDSDFLCLNDVWRKEDKDAFIKAAKDSGAFLYNAQFETNSKTPPNDIRLEDGTTPDIPAPRSSCGDNADLANNLISCIQTSCSLGAPTDDTALLKSADCISQKCLGSVVKLATGDTPEKQGCFGCVVFDLEAYQSFGYMKQDCFDPNGSQGYFQGQNGNLILSKFPTSNTQGYVLPGAGQKRVIVSTTVEPEAGKKIDLHCGAMDAILDPPFNYYGPYSPSHDAQGYMDEQHLQTVRAIEWIKSRSKDLPALIGLGVFASETDPNPDTKTRNARFVDRNPAVPKLLRTAFTSAEASGYQPLCTVCGDTNPLDDLSTYAWYHRIFINDHFNPAAVVSSERRYTDNVVKVSDTLTVPLSENYSYRVKVLRP
jgi:hypothetical protein